MTQRFYLGLAIAAFSLLLLFVLTPRLRVWRNEKIRRKLESWLATGPSCLVAAKDGCSFCGGKRIKKIFYGSYARQDLLKRVEHSEVDAVRFYEHRCGDCGSLICKEKEDLLAQPTSLPTNESSNNEQARQLFLAGLQALEGKDFAQAEALFMKSLVLAPDRVSILTNLSAVQVVLQKYEPALAGAKKSVEIEPANLEGWLNCGLANARLGRFEAAVSDFKKAIEIAPDCFEASFELGLVLKELNRLGEAVESLQRALTLRPEDATARMQLKRARDELGAPG